MGIFFRIFRVSPRIRTGAFFGASLASVWLLWFAHQVRLSKQVQRGVTPLEEVKQRLREVSNLSRLYAEDQAHALLSLSRLLLALCHLFAPFLHDLFILTRLGLKTIPIPVQIGVAGLLSLSYILYKFRWARQVAFIFPAVILFFVSKHIPEFYLLTYFIPLLSIYLPTIESLRAFISSRERSNYHSVVSQWLHYWALAPLTVTLASTLQEKILHELQELSKIRDLPITALELTAESPHNSILSGTRPLLLVLLWLVVWQSADLAFDRVTNILKILKVLITDSLSVFLNQT